MSSTSAPIVKSADMEQEQQTEALEIASTLYAELKSKQSELASALKGKLDETFGGPWHVVVGKSFSSSVSHEKNGFIYFYIENLAFLCFRTA
ncbi:hypothetical protein PICMEDRAFT_15668 [Pichia membranifaciens NRRL Y-2026]|uniref:Dynein light chain n=1 Tax=Pichia membranifaciens NRRL Y-2026 TaxID=763406 RepID=A0A1E3NNV4_9ASCO|nr:hypothetical protein PICMEDRAFT_15668 [Pichia membranifaciens NRRL Y-2026]ODQ47769.1 hypothetical protein PICMEDRAFT_15668 [Pichia membranifaciens NRRL Y-2026]